MNTEILSRTEPARLSLRAKPRMIGSQGLVQELAQVEKGRSAKTTGRNKLSKERMEVREQSGEEGGISGLIE